MSDRPTADVGIIGGSGFYSLFPNFEEVATETPYGAPSDSVFVASLEGRRVAFLPRHGRNHSVPPHRVNYRANIWALRQLGVRYLISPCAAGSLQPHIHPGDFVVCDQYVDRTRGRADTFYDGPEVYHVSLADPYCPHLRQLATDVIREHGIQVHDRGTVVTINGPRFSTRAESTWFSDAGWEVVSMTQYPEAYLALELEIAPVNISLITDYDCGLHAAGLVEAVTAAEVMAVLRQNSERIRSVVLEMARRIPAGLDSPCHRALEHARL
ncbi:MAG TPA: S-methyl-5'-thioadenosine phosphorylase [Chthonomonadales bacterium]|nr:S-methyl-5'-thioadenosine phosphorylase [Chthonomonadales bacterium]